MSKSVTIDTAGANLSWVRIVPMSDHYAIIGNGNVVGVVCQSPGSSADKVWSVDLLSGKVDGVSSYIPLKHALQAANTWKPNY